MSVVRKRLRACPLSELESHALFSQGTCSLNNCELCLFLCVMRIVQTTLTTAVMEFGVGDVEIPLSMWNSQRCFNLGRVCT